mmetsp:Transcript_36797/g.94102  ORF Transcript_36797/g.94102 Transcript_36797/m.94102 type:complete len:206 (-) Transcript_36797:888-1505(-)
MQSYTVHSYGGPYLHPLLLRCSNLSATNSAPPVSSLLWLLAVVSALRPTYTWPKPPFPSCRSTMYSGLPSTWHFSGRGDVEASSSFTSPQLAFFSSLSPSLKPVRSWTSGSGFCPASCGGASSPFSPFSPSSRRSSGCEAGGAAAWSARGHSSRSPSPNRPWTRRRACGGSAEGAAAPSATLLRFPLAWLFMFRHVPEMLADARG